MAVSPRHTQRNRSHNLMAKSSNWLSVGFEITFPIHHSVYIFYRCHLFFYQTKWSNFNVSELWSNIVSYEGTRQSLHFAQVPLRIPNAYVQLSGRQIQEIFQACSESRRWVPEPGKLMHFAGHERISLLIQLCNDHVADITPSSASFPDLYYPVHRPYLFSSFLSLHVPLGFHPN